MPHDTSNKIKKMDISSIPQEMMESIEKLKAELIKAEKLANNIPRKELLEAIDLTEVCIGFCLNQKRCAHIIIKSLIDHIYEWDWKITEYIKRGVIPSEKAKDMELIMNNIKSLWWYIKCLLVDYSPFMPLVPKALTHNKHGVNTRERVKQLRMQREYELVQSQKGLMDRFGILVR